MKPRVACIILGACLVLGACSALHAQDLNLGRSGPPYIEATVTMPTKLMKNAEKRCDMVSDLAEKSEMNYRVLAMKIMEKWQSSIKNDKDFLKNLMQYKKVSFTVRKDGSIVIKGVADPPPDAKAASGKKGSTKRPAVPAKDSGEN